MRFSIFYFTAAVACFLSLFCCIFVSASVSVSSSRENFDFPVDAFSVSPGLISGIVPFNESQSLFLLPDSPSNAVLVKLINALSSNSKRIGILIYMVRQFSHYDPASAEMFQNTIESFKTLSMLHKSIASVNQPAVYAAVIDAITELTTSFVTFLRSFISSLILKRLGQVEDFKTVILDFTNLEAAFYILTNFVAEDSQNILIDLIFSAVDSEDEERLVWSFYKTFASPSICIPLPHEFLVTGHSKQLRNLLVDDLVKILSSSTEKFNTAWLTQLGLLIRFRIISNSEALRIAEIFSVLFERSKKNKFETGHLCNFMRLVFLDDLITLKPETDEVVVNFLNRLPPKTPENLEQFYISLWNLIVSKIPVDSDSEELSQFLVHVIKELEMKFPEISQNFDDNLFDDFEVLKSLEIIRKINDMKFDFSNSEGKRKIFEFFSEFQYEITVISIKNFRLVLNMIYDRLIETVRALSSLDSPSDNKLSSVDNNIIDNQTTDSGDDYSLQIVVTKSLKNYTKFLPKFQEISEVELFLNFAFTLTKISDAEKFFDFIYDKISGNSNLISFFFSKFAEKLRHRLDFFFVRFDRSEFKKFDKITIETFLENIKNLPLTAGTILFLTGAYVNNFMTPEKLFIFLEKFKSKNYLNLKFNGPEILGFFAAISDVSFFEFQEESTSEFLNQKIENSQEIAIKSFQVLTSFEGDLREEFESGLIPWLCARLVSFENLKPEASEIDQLADFENLKSTALSINDSATLCTKILSIFLQNGASNRDLRHALVFLKNLRQKFTMDLFNQEKKHLAVAASFCLLIFIIRSNDSLVPSDFALESLNAFKLKTYRISVPQLIYKAYKDPKTRSGLLLPFIHASFDQNDFGLVHDPEIFTNLTDSAASAHIDALFRQTFTAEGIDRIRLEAFCFWINLGLIPLNIVKDIVKRIDRPINIKLSISLLRSIYKQEIYRPIRKLAAQNLFANVDHTYIVPRPFAMGIVAAVSDLVAEPEFFAALKQPTKYSEDIRAIFKSEHERRLGFNFDALNLSDGIENVIEIYSQALCDLSTFSLSLARKHVLLKSIFSNLTRLTSSDGEADLIGETFTITLLDHFVRIAVYLTVQIHSDYVAPVYINDINEEFIELCFLAIVQYVRDSNVQGLLVYHVLTVIKNRAETRAAVFDLLPRFINWRRFLLIPDSFRFIFNFNAMPERFDTFMTETIEAAFRFKDLHPTDAIDTSRDTNQILMVHESFFATMAVLIKDYNLPGKYTVQALKLMNENYDVIEIISTILVQFLRIAIKDHQILKDSKVSQLTAMTYGPVQDCRREIIQLVLEFLEKRPDWLSIALVNDKGEKSFQLMLELEVIAKNYQIFNNSNPIKLIRSIFNWPNSGIESLKLLPRVYLPKHTIRSIVSWICNSSEPFVSLALIVLDLIPSTFTIETFTDSKVSQSWSSISVSVFDWISKLISERAKQFGQNFDEKLIEKYFNLLLWSLKFDGKEEDVSKALNLFFESLSFATNEEVKYRAIRSLNSNYFRPLFLQLTLNFKNLHLISSSLRKLSENNAQLSKEVENLIPLLFKRHVPVEEDEILSERTAFLTNLKKFEEAENNEQVELFEILFRQISRLRKEHDLTTKFIEKLGILMKKFYLKSDCEATEKLAVYLCKTVVLLEIEIVLHGNSQIFVDFFRFVYKFGIKSDEYFWAIQIILSQITSETDIQRIFAAIIQDLRLDCCLISWKSLPKRFQQNRQLFELFLSSYLEKMNQIGSRSAEEGRVGLDGIHFIAIFNILFHVNASDSLFHLWIENISRINENDLLTEEFAENLRSFCLKRKNFIPEIAKIYIDEFFISKMFKIGTDRKCKEDLLAFFKLVFLNDSQLYQKLVSENLSIELQIQMRESVGVVFNEKKRKLVQDFVAKCNLPETQNFKVSEFVDLAPKLEILLKLDLNLLPGEEFASLFNNLDILVQGLVNEILFENCSTVINLVAISCALQIKNGFPVDANELLLILRGNSVLNVKEEIVNLILSKISKLNCDFARGDAIALAGMVQKSSEPTEILKNLLKNQNLTTFKTLIIKTILETEKKSDKLEIHLILQNILPSVLKQNRSEQSEELNALFQLARTQKLLNKTQLLLLEKLI